MLVEQLNIIKSSVESFFDGVYDSFESINMNEHLNETLCFVGISGYKMGKSLPNVAGVGYSPLNATFTVTALGKRNMSANDLVGYVDSRAVPAVRLTDLEVLSINRKPCVYSKEHGRYSVSFEIETYREQPTAYASKLSVLFGTTSFAFFNDWECLQGYKTYKLGSLYGNSICGTVRKEPCEIAVKGELIASAGQTAYLTVSAYLGTVMSLSLDGTLFSNMLLKEVEYEKNGESASIVAKFCEVSG